MHLAGMCLVDGFLRFDFRKTGFVPNCPYVAPTALRWKKVRNAVIYEQVKHMLMKWNCAQIGDSSRSIPPDSRRLENLGFAEQSIDEGMPQKVAPG
jgi:hypothetical protein